MQALGFWRIVPDAIIIVLGAFPLLYFLASTFLKLRKVEPGAGVPAGDSSNVSG